MISASAEKNQISFAQEVIRKTTHMGALVVPCGYYILGLERLTMVYILGVAALLMFLIDVSRLRNWVFWHSFAKKLGGKMIRDHEKKGDFTGATYILLSFCFTIALYDKPIAIAAIAFIIVGDTFAALIGRKFGRHKFRTKSVEGSLGCLLGTCIVAMLTPELALPVGLIGAFVATVTEAVSFGIDDNVSVPLVSGLVMTFLLKIPALV